MANISEVIGSFFIRPVNELKELFKDQSDEWLAQFFKQVIENIKDPEAKTKWADLVVAVIPSSACKHITIQFLERLGCRYHRLELSKCPLQKDLRHLNNALLDKHDITPILKRIPYNHHNHGDCFGLNVFNKVCCRGRLEDITKLIDFYATQVSPEKLQDHLQKTLIPTLFCLENLKHLINLYKLNGMDPLSFILPTDTSTAVHSVLGGCSLSDSLALLHEVPLDHLKSFVKRFGLQFLASNWGFNIPVILEAFENAGIPRLEFILARNEQNQTILEVNYLSYTFLFDCISDEEKCALLFSSDLSTHPSELVQELKRLEQRPDIMAKKFQTMKPEDLQAFFKKQSNEWMYEFFCAVKEGGGSIDLLKSTIPPGTCRQITSLLFESEAVETDEPECAVEEDLILLECAISDKCRHNIDRLLRSIPLYHHMGPMGQQGLDVFDLVFGHGELTAKFLDIHLEKTGPAKLNEFLRGKKVIRWNLLPNSGKLIEDYTKKGLDLVSFMFEPDDLDYFAIDLLFSDIYETILPLIPLHRLIAHVKKYGAEILKGFHYRRIEKNIVLDSYHRFGVSPSAFTEENGGYKDGCP